jgi:alpha-tubulin suppressor-like RCC1 family protein
MAAMAGVRLRSVAAGIGHNFALGWDGRVYSWGENKSGQLGHGDKLDRSSPALVPGLGRVCSISTGAFHSLAVTQLGHVFQWGEALLWGDDDSEDAGESEATQGSLRPTRVERLDGVRMCRVYAGDCTAFAIGEDGELFSWGRGEGGPLGHGETRNQPMPKRVEALRGVRMSSVSVGGWYALALTEDGLVYAWGNNCYGAVLGNPHVDRELLPMPVEALRGVRVGSVAAMLSFTVRSKRSYAIAVTGELWAWGSQSRDSLGSAPLGHGEIDDCPLPKPIESLRGVKVDAVAAGIHHTLALAEDGSVYAWGGETLAGTGALGLGPGVRDAGRDVRTPQRMLLLLSHVSVSGAVAGACV